MPKAISEAARMELMFIVRPDLAEAARKTVLKEIKDYVTEAGGSIYHQDDWQKRDLAYRIKGFEEGYYHIFYFEGAETEKFADLERNIRINPNVLRHLLTKLPKDHEIIKYDDATADQKVEAKPKAAKTTKKAGNLEGKLDAIINDDDLKV